MHGLAASEILLKQTLNAYKSVNCYSLSEENDEEYENPSDVEIIRLMDQEEYVPEIYKMRMASLLDDLLEDHPELVPSLVDIWYFAEVSQLNGLISVTEYLDRNDKPDQLSDPTAQTWPLPPSSFLYT
ncbi:conserved hypothetical protein [Echinococcus multilocularis]|uniref:Uncharacterized protein n=1 Tax=Echinococcus multilocularis TaxID=6211 RepID=A0A068Y507_ECHMU|nr:conserved hypothetical protein [Echinococcus multilocularis]